MRAPRLIPAWENGTLRPVEKMAVHRRGLRHKAVSVFVVRGPQMLLQRRAAGKYHSGGLWANTCCTHPEWGEDPAHCARRRLFEETGIAGLDPVHRGVLEYRADVGQGLVEHEVVDLFVAEADGPVAVDPDPAEVAELAWHDIARLRRAVANDPGAYVPWLPIYLDDDRIRASLSHA